MWDDVIIGKGHRGNSACRMFFGPNAPDISESSTAYWVRPAYMGLGPGMGMGMTVFKDTPEGRGIAHLCKEKSFEPLKEYLERIFLSHVSSDTLRLGIEKALDESYVKGKRDAQREIQIALGL
jgi:hypothetical protein